MKALEILASPTNQWDAAVGAVSEDYPEIAELVELVGRIRRDATVVALEAAAKVCIKESQDVCESIEKTLAGRLVTESCEECAKAILALITNDAALAAARSELVREAVENERKKWTMLYHEPSGAVLDFGAMCWRCRNGDPLGPHGVSHKYDEYSFAECDAKPIREAFMEVKS